MTTPLHLLPFVSSFNRFFIFPSIKSFAHGNPSEQLKASWICPKTTTFTTRGSLGRILSLVSPSPVSTVGPAVCYRFMALLWA